MNQDSTSQNADVSYRTLGLIANPFRTDDVGEYGVQSATASEGHRLLDALDLAAAQERPKPITVIKHPLPTQYSLNAVSRAEYVLCNDDDFNVLHAYIPLFVMHTGRIRSTLAVFSERLAFRSFSRTLAMYVDRILAEPDADLISYQVLGQERWDAFARSFREDSRAAIESVFGNEQLERRPELAEVHDLRLTQLEIDGVEEEDAAEVDTSVGDAPGMEVILAEDADSLELDQSNEAVLDYLVEYTKIHLSPVIARALRVFHQRGLAAMAAEFRITKAPRKTLAALVKFARVRFRKVALMYDGFGNWSGVPAPLRGQITTSLSELRWMLDGDAVMVALLEQDGVPEIEEQFSAGRRLEWTFSDVRAVFAAPDEIDPDMIDRWLAAATLRDYKPITTADPVISALISAADGSLERFVSKAAKAVDSAASRGATLLDEEAREAGMHAEPQGAQPL